MGLGKTVQAVAFLERVTRVEGLPGPFLVVAPLSTLMHWQRTVQQWTDMNAIVYQNTKQSREIIRNYEFFYPDGTGQGRQCALSPELSLTAQDEEK